MKQLSKTTRIKECDSDISRLEIAAQEAFGRLEAARLRRQYLSRGTKIDDPELSEEMQGLHEVWYGTRKKVRVKSQKKTALAGAPQVLPSIERCREIIMDDAIRDGEDGAGAEVIQVAGNPEIRGLAQFRIDSETAHRLGDRTSLWAHCVSEHAVILPPETSLLELTNYHDHEHDGPGTIRNHKRSSRHYSIKKIGEVLSEADDVEIRS